MRDPDKPIDGQPAAILAITPDGPYLARFPYETAGGEDQAVEAARAWHKRKRMGKQVRIWRFTGRYVPARPIYDGQPEEV